MTLTTATIHSNALPDPVNEFFTSKQFPRALSNIINEYVMKRPNCFGGAEFRHFLGIDVGDPTLPYNEFIAWWDDFDALDLLNKVKNPRRNWQTHLGLVFRPESIRDMSSDKDQAYNLETLAKYVGNPMGGGNPTFFNKGLSIREVWNQNARTLAGPGCWLVRHKDIVARNQTYQEGKNFLRHLNQETGASYEPENTLLDLATDAAVRHVFNGERHFGDSTGIENQWTFVFSKALVSIENNYYPAALGGFDPNSVIDATFNRCDSRGESCGVAVIRKFSGSVKSLDLRQPIVKKRKVVSNTSLFLSWICGSFQSPQKADS